MTNKERLDIIQAQLTRKFAKEAHMDYVSVSRYRHDENTLTGTHSWYGAPVDEYHGQDFITVGFEAPNMYFRIRENSIDQDILAGKQKFREACEEQQMEYDSGEGFYPLGANEEDMHRNMAKLESALPQMVYETKARENAKEQVKVNTAEKEMALD